MAEDVPANWSLARGQLTSREPRWRRCQSSLSASQGSGCLPAEGRGHTGWLLQPQREQLPAPKVDSDLPTPPNLTCPLKNHSHPSTNISRENRPSGVTHHPYRWQDADLAGHRSARPFHKSAEDLWWERTQEHLPLPE